jgi:surface antigen
MKQWKAGFVIMALSSLTGCQVVDGITGTGIGPEAEALCGNGIGRAVEGSDYFVANTAFVKATRMAVGDSAYWENGRTGNWGYYCPIRDGHTRIYGDYCRELMSTVCINGQMQRIYSTVCRHPNGTWYTI